MSSLFKFDSSFIYTPHCRFPPEIYSQRYFNNYVTYTLTPRQPLFQIIALFVSSFYFNIFISGKDYFWVFADRFETLSQPSANLSLLAMFLGVARRLVPRVSEEVFWCRSPPGREGRPVSASVRSGPRCRGHVHKRYSSIESCPRARLSDFFRGTQNEM